MMIPLLPKASLSFAVPETSNQEPAAPTSEAPAAVVTEESSDGSCSNKADGGVTNGDKENRNSDSNRNSNRNSNSDKRTILPPKNLRSHLGDPEGGGYWAIRQQQFTNNKEDRRSRRRCQDPTKEQDSAITTTTIDAMAPSTATIATATTTASTTTAITTTTTTATTTATATATDPVTSRRPLERGDWWFLPPSNHDAICLARSRSVVSYDRRRTARKSSRQNIDRQPLQHAREVSVASCHPRNRGAAPTGETTDEIARRSTIFREAVERAKQHPSYAKLDLEPGEGVVLV